MDTSQSLESIYTEHNKNKRGEYFITMESERGPFLRKAVGTGKRVLDIGCRDGALTKYFTEGNSVTGFDIDAGALERAKKIIPIETKQVDLNSDWGVPHKYFDVVVAAEVLEHLYYPEKITEKAAYVLDDEGIFVGSVPFAYSVQSKIRYLFGIKRHTPLQDPTHINHFTHAEFNDMLKRHFKEVEITSIVSLKFKWISFLFPYAFAHMFLFVAKYPQRK